MYEPAKVLYYSKTDCGELACWMVAGTVGLRWMVGVMGHLNKFVLARHGCRRRCRRCRSPDQSRRHRRQARRPKAKTKFKLRPH